MIFVTNIRSAIGLVWWVFRWFMRHTCLYISDPIISFGLRNGGPKNHQFNLAALFELITSHIFAQETLGDICAGSCDQNTQIERWMKAWLSKTPFKLLIFAMEFRRLPRKSSYSRRSKSKAVITIMQNIPVQHGGGSLWFVYLRPKEERKNMIL